MKNLDEYKTATGCYDTAKIRTDAGMDSRAAAFLDIFGSFDDDGKDKGDQLPGEWQALLEEAERRNDEIFAAAEQTKEQEAHALTQQPEPWSRETWKRLVELGFATRYTEDGSEQGYMSTSYSLTERGEQLLDPNYRASGLYDDHAGIDG